MVTYFSRIHYNTFQVFCLSKTNLKSRLFVVKHGEAFKRKKYLQFVRYVMLLRKLRVSLILFPVTVTNI